MSLYLVCRCLLGRSAKPAHAHAPPRCAGLHFPATCAVWGDGLRLGVNTRSGNPYKLISMNLDWTERWGSESTVSY